ncbi:inhibitor of nuclear factor kappa-B kinase subunit beta [Topomyia yanbarensis]|uniref:inhibitor of nuclear factor kappa-B kinase subunit beta n=1 Tax=Topomyia yanbarensis TaxID=2498891 RepID=UPI00273AE4C8|nr:inhibitor of nuclear factor kappa-B kinase subunit beta [Topomyia yanbarensis]
MLAQEDPSSIGEWYREKRLGSGGFGVVTLWKNQQTKEMVAIKKFHILQDKSEMTEKHCERWRNEVSLMTNKVRNENIVSTVQVKPDSFIIELAKISANKLPILCMEYCEGGDLRRVLNRASNCSGLRELEVRDILRSLRNAISCLHSLKITHRDIKPENIVLKQEGDRVVYKLTDLGYAKALDKQSLNASLVGTVEYIAPDLIYCDRYNCSVDYWSMGIIGFEIICGIRPFIPHATVAKWMMHVQLKKSMHIAITEDNSDNYVYHSEIYPHNHIAPDLKNHLEKWLRLALEWNPKQRGYVFQTGTKEETDQQLKSVTFADSPAGSKQPVQVLKVFSMLDDILQKKFLTIFCLFNCSFLSMEIDESSDLDMIKDHIEAKTNIARDAIEFVLPLEQKLDRVTESTKPIDLYLAGLYEKPMLYVVNKQGAIIQPDLKPEIPKSVSDVFQNIRVKLKPHMLRQFAGNAHFFVTNEQRLYVLALEGIKNYALVLNEEIVKCKDEVGQLNKITYGISGGLEYHKLTLNHTQEKMSAKKLSNVTLRQSFTLWQERCSRMEASILKLIEVADKVTKRYDSVLKRSRDSVGHHLLKDYEQQDHFNLKGLDGRYEIVRAQILEKNTHEKSHIDMLQAVYECLKKRDILLRDYAFKELQQQLVDIRREMQEIRKALQKALEHAEKFKKELARMTLEHNDNIWNLLQNLLESTQKLTSNENPATLSDIEQLMGSVSLQSKACNGGLPNGPDFHVGGTVSSLQDSLGKSLLSKSLLCFGEGPDVESLITANNSLIMTTDDLLNDGFDFFK